MSMYADYVKERTSRSILETEYGFVVFSYEGEDYTLFIHELFVRKESRRRGHGARMIEELILDAGKRGAQQIVGCVDPRALNADESMKIILAYGLKPYGIHGEFVAFGRKI